MNYDLGYLPARLLVKITFTPSNIRIIRLTAFNALLIVVGLMLITVAGEAYFRVNAPYGFAANPKDFVDHPGSRFVPNVGMMLGPHSEVRYTNNIDYWVIAQSNGIGFLDREPISPGRAAKSCHIALIGDSFIDAWEVPIAVKTQVKLESLAARELPYLDITTSGFGRVGTGQISQLAFYDEYARHLRPKVVILVFVHNDFMENSTILIALEHGLDPDHLPRVTAQRGPDGSLELRPPYPDYEAFKLPPLPGQTQLTSSAGGRAVNIVSEYSYFATWLTDGFMHHFFQEQEREPIKLKKWKWRVETLNEQSRYSTIFQGWTPSVHREAISIFAESDLPPVFEDALSYTKFGLEQFKQRAERDGAKLVILTAHNAGLYGNLLPDRLKAMAEELDIPVVDQREYIVRIGADPKNAEFKRDLHWNENGHLWAAEALLEWLKDNQEVCDQRG